MILDENLFEIKEARGSKEGVKRGPYNKEKSKSKEDLYDELQDRLEKEFYFPGVAKGGNLKVNLIMKDENKAELKGKKPARLIASSMSKYRDIKDEKELDTAKKIAKEMGFKTELDKTKRVPTLIIKLEESLNEKKSNRLTYHEFVDYLDSIDNGYTGFAKVTGNKGSGYRYTLSNKLTREQHDYLAQYDNVDFGTAQYRYAPEIKYDTVILLDRMSKTSPMKEDYDEDFFYTYEAIRHGESDPNRKYSGNFENSFDAIELAEDDGYDEVVRYTYDFISDNFDDYWGIPPRRTDVIWTRKKNHLKEDIVKTSKGKWVNKGKVKETKKGFYEIDGTKEDTFITESKHWREKVVAKTKNGKIVKNINVSSVYNDRDYYTLFDKDGNFVENSLDFNYLNKKLYKLDDTKEDTFITESRPTSKDYDGIEKAVNGAIYSKEGQLDKLLNKVIVEMENLYGPWEWQPGAPDTEEEYRRNIRDQFSQIEYVDEYISEWKGIKEGRTLVDLLTQIRDILDNNLPPKPNYLGDERVNESVNSELIDEFAYEYGLSKAEAKKRLKNLSKEEQEKKLKLLKQGRSKNAKADFYESINGAFYGRQDVRDISIEPGYHEWVLKVDGQNYYSFGDISETINSYERAKDFANSELDSFDDATANYFDRNEEDIRFFDNAKEIGKLDGSEYEEIYQCLIDVYIYYVGNIGVKESVLQDIQRDSIEHDFEDITNMSDAKERLKKYGIDLIKKDNRNYVLRKDGKEYTFYVLSNPNEVRKDLVKAVYKLTSGNSAIKDNSITESKGVIRKYKGYTLHDAGDSITITDPHGKTVGTERTEIGAEGLIDDLVVGKDIKENIGSDIAEYQKWVDYDMKKYGRISSLTNHKVRKAGLKIVKDKYGDYEVIADEPIREDLEREFTIHYNREGFEFGGYGAVRVKATNEDEAKEKFYAEKKDDKITISSIRPTENEDIRKGIRLLETKKVEESLKNNEVADFFDKAKKLGVKTLKDLKILLAQPESKGDSEKEKLDNYSKEANPEDKDLTEDVKVVDKNQTEIDKKVGLENLLNDLINDENEAINGYNSAIVNFELEGKSDLTDVFRDIIKDEQNHIGNLQKVLNEINPTTIANLEQGQQEAADTLNK